MKKKHICLGKTHICYSMSFCKAWKVRFKAIESCGHSERYRSHKHHSCSQ